MIKKILVANRGEIAVRAIRACKEMDIKTVAIYSKADKDAMHAKIADEAICIGDNPTSESYTNKQAVLTAAIVTNVDAIFPGYGFLSENASFAKMVEDHGFNFIGPSHKHISIMGDKIEAKNMAKKLGLPLVPGSKGEIKTKDEAIKVAKEYGYPVLIKAAAGGGGRGIRLVNKEEEMAEAFAISKNEAKQFFSNDAVYIEKFIANPRHIEVQILGDKHGNVIHLYERECSMQRNNQKVLEESPSPGITKKEREYICNLSAKAMAKMGYYSAGTIEYLYYDGKFYFMEMNTRLQVEHPVTESVTGVDLLFEMIKVADNQKLTLKQSDIKISGHAIECRINAENPETFAPSPGKIEYFYQTSGLGVRLDTAIYTGYRIPPYYDSMIAKLIIYGTSRNHAIKRAKRSLDELIIQGIETTIPLHKRILNNSDFIKGNYNIKWLETFLKLNKS